MNLPSFAVAVVSHNTREFLASCVASTQGQGALETIVVDSGSSDGSAEMVAADFPEVRLEIVHNRGYGAGANVAFRQTTAEVILLLNADTQLTTGAAAGLAEYLGRHPRVAVAGPRIVGLDGRVQRTARRFPTAIEVLKEETGLHRLVDSHPSAGSVDWVLGAALAVRASAFHEVGGFDESFYMYGEETDLCMRLKGRGWQIHYVPSASVIHVGGASTSQQRAPMLAQYVGSLRRLQRRYGAPRQEAMLRFVLGSAYVARYARDRARLALGIGDESPLRQALATWRVGLQAVRRPGR